MHFYCEVGNWIQQEFHFVNELLKSPVKNRFYNILKCKDVRFRQLDEAEVAHNSLTHLCPCWSHRRNKLDVFNLFFFKTLSVVPPQLAKPLSNQLQRRLSTVFFFIGHIDVVYEDYIDHVYHWPIHPFPSLLLLQLRLQQVLKLRTIGCSTHRC